MSKDIQRAIEALGLDSDLAAEVAKLAELSKTVTPAQVDEAIQKVRALTDRANLAESLNPDILADVVDLAEVAQNTLNEAYPTVGRLRHEAMNRGLNVLFQTDGDRACEVAKWAANRKKVHDVAEVTSRTWMDIGVAIDDLASNEDISLEDAKRVIFGQTLTEEFKLRTIAQNNRKYTIKRIALDAAQRGRNTEIGRNEVATDMSGGQGIAAESRQTRADRIKSYTQYEGDDSEKLKGIAHFIRSAGDIAYRTVGANEDGTANGTPTAARWAKVSETSHDPTMMYGAEERYFLVQKRAWWAKAGRIAFNRAKLAGTVRTQDILAELDRKVQESDFATDWVQFLMNCPNSGDEAYNADTEHHSLFSTDATYRPERVRTGQSRMRLAATSVFPNARKVPIHHEVAEPTRNGRNQITSPTTVKVVGTRPSATDWDQGRAGDVLGNRGLKLQTLARSINRPEADVRDVLVILARTVREVVKEYDGLEADKMQFQSARVEMMQSAHNVGMAPITSIPVKRFEGVELPNRPATVQVLINRYYFDEGTWIVRAVGNALNSLFLGAPWHFTPSEQAARLVLLEESAHYAEEAQKARTRAITARLRNAE